MVLLSQFLCVQPSSFHPRTFVAIISGFSPALHCAADKNEIEYVDLISLFSSFPRALPRQRADGSVENKFSASSAREGISGEAFAALPTEIGWLLSLSAVQRGALFLSRARAADQTCSSRICIEIGWRYISRLGRESLIFVHRAAGIRRIGWNERYRLTATPRNLNDKTVSLLFSIKGDGKRGGKCPD